MSNTANQLIVLEELNPVELFKPNGLDPVLKEVDEKARSVILNGVETQKDRDNIRSIAAKVGSTKSTLQKIGTKYTEKMRASVQESNAERDRGVNFLQKLQDDIRDPLTEYEEAEKQRKADADRAIEILSEVVDFSDEDIGEINSENIKHRITRLDLLYKNLHFSKEFSDEEQEKYVTRAEHIYGRTKTSLDKKLEQELQYEADKAELAKLREKQAAQEKKDEQDRIAKDAADKATADAEKKAKEERESQQKIASDKLAAEKEKSDRLEREKQEEKDKVKKAETDRIAAEKKADQDKKDAVQAEKDRQSAKKLKEKEAAEKREANKKHRAKINNNAKDALIRECKLGDVQAQAVVESIARSDIQGVTITY